MDSQELSAVRRFYPLRKGVAIIIVGVATGKVRELQ
jgi:hypothetical protein